jgi:hypothetical protein
MCVPMIVVLVILAWKVRSVNEGWHIIDELKWFGTAHPALLCSLPLFLLSASFARVILTFNTHQTQVCWVC